MKKRVLRSIETADGGRCVDVFERPDGQFGFEIYRRDTEDLTGWFPIGGHAEKPFMTEAMALDAAKTYAPWLEPS